MAKFEIRVVGQRRESVDVKALAGALLEFIDRLSDADRRKLADAGERVLNQPAEGRPRKGRAA